MKRLITLIVSLLFISLSSSNAQPARWEKLSPMLRQMVREQLPASKPFSSPSVATMTKSLSVSSPEVCAFIRIDDNPSDVFNAYGCRDLASIGNVHIASIPIDRLGALSLDKRVKRIEARSTGHVLLDTVARCVHSTPIYDGMSLPQAYTGRGVVVGLMDIGFDLTHPTFRTTDGSPRICRIWDMLSTDTIGSRFYVGRDYTTPEELLVLAHSRDGLDQTHGTHTAAIAAGNGFNSPYRGLAPESDICLVANAVSENIALVDSALWSRYTFATDALGFKYLFDYAQSTDQPCVVSFSEGSGQDFWGYDQLYYEMLNGLLGPGHIMVVAAGNEGQVKSWFCKPVNNESMGMFVRYQSSPMLLTLKSAADFSMRIVCYPDGSVADTLTIAANDVLKAADSLLVVHTSETDSVLVQAYPNCYDADETCYDLMLCSSTNVIGTETPLSFEVLGNQAEVTCWRYNGEWTTNDLNQRLNAGEPTHNILSPGSAPRIICVGATTYRDSILNYQSEWKHNWQNEHGLRASFSSVGPTMDGRVKPDVMAPGNNIISAYSSYYLENHPTANDVKWDVEHFDYKGRTYAWNSNTGTSMACPVVAGVIALWLQAKPDLTPEDVMGVISRTSRRPDPSLDYPNVFYGYGEIDAYRGLLDILGVDIIPAVSTTHTSARITLKGRQLVIDVPLSAALDGGVTLSLYSLTGRQVFQLPSALLSQPSSTIHLPESIPPGIYAVQLDGPTTVSGSTLIRISQ